ncbi:MAG: hypothetical protein V3V20_02445 [Algisphaera sp.]
MLRLIWAVMLGGQAVLAVVLMNVRPAAGQGAGVSPGLAWVPFGLLLVGVPVAYFIRNQSYKRAWRGHAVTPAGYQAGNVAVFAVLEVAMVAGLVLGVLLRAGTPALAAVAAAFVLMLFNFPSGRPMEPTTPQLGERSERSAAGEH